jgi:hypothetical protein
MRKPLDKRVSALFNPRLVVSKFACAFIDATLETTEKEAIELFLLEYEPASMRAAKRPCVPPFLLRR